MTSASANQPAKTSPWLSLIQATLIFLLITTITQGYSLFRKEALGIVYLEVVILSIAIGSAIAGVLLRKRWSRTFAVLPLVYWIGSRLLLGWTYVDRRFLNNVFRDQSIPELLVWIALLSLFVIVVAEVVWLLSSSKARSLLSK